jgi:recombination protein RecR
MPDPLERLTSLFERFPGIGPRQAGRFVQYLLRSSPTLRRELAEAVRELGGSVSQCPQCFRYHAGDKNLCSICSSTTRDPSSLSVVATDADLLALERTETYTGLYFVLGGTISLASEKTSGLRIKELLTSLPMRAKNGLTEIILAFPANPEGDATAERLREEITTIAATYDMKISALGRGLSTGSELEYADPDTIKNAFDSRR